MPTIAIRDAVPADAAAVFAVESAAFGRQDEARIVEAIRGTVDEAGSFLALESRCVIAHAFFSRVRIEGTERARAAALGPVAVMPNRQREGIGGRLIRHGIDAMRTNFDLLFVLGDPRYYNRFGFELACEAGFGYAEGFERAFQFMRSGSERGTGGRVMYHAAFQA